MINAIRRFWRDERGMSFMMVGISLMAFVVACSLSIDVGMMFTARTQAQNAADAGALAGATALAFNSFTDHTATGPAKQSAVNAAQANVIMGASPGDVAKTVGPGDVSFLAGTGGQMNRVQVNVHRTTDAGNPLPTFFARLFGVPWVSVAATATAEASPADAMTCVKPFMIPDKWIEKSTPANTTFDNGRDTYIPANRSGYSGYTVQNDVGTLLTLRAGTGGNIVPSFYYSWKMANDIGGNYYRDNIATCNQQVVHWGDQMIQEPGNMVGPTVQGITMLVDQDPNARWDTSCKCVKDSAFGSHSPRVFPIPLYDPQDYAINKQNGRDAEYHVANFLGFFALRPQGNNVSGYITTVVGTVDPNAGPAPMYAFPVSIRLVQ